MPKRKAPKSWAEELAELEDPAPRGKIYTHSFKSGNPANRSDFDPEDDGVGEISEDEAELNSDSGESQADAREHYEDVGYEKLLNCLDPLSNSL